MPTLNFRTMRNFLVFLFLSLSAQRIAAETLREALNEKQLPIAGAKLANLDNNITSGAQLDDANQFVIAYYVDDGSDVLNRPMFLERFDRKRREWTSGSLASAETKSGAIDVNCFGAILSVSAAAKRLLVDTHINPSAGCLLVLSPELKLEVGLYGWLVGRLGEMLIYHRSQIHFAPVHPAEIAIYDLQSKRDVTIFPRKPEQAIRRARTLQLQAFYKSNDEWCNRNNDPCDPEYFDSALDGAVATNEVESALAFLISYEQIQLVQGDVQKPDGPKDVLYACRGVRDDATTECRELLLGEAKARFGDGSLQNLLQHDVLQKLFSETPARKP